MHLFKYVSGHVDTLLTKNLLKVTPPNEFDDPNEFCTSFVQPSDSDRHARLEYLLNKLPADLKLIAESELRDPATLTQVLQSLEAGAKECIRLTQDTLSKTYGVLCFTENENDLRMWAGYADEHRGALVEFDVAQIQQCWGAKIIKVDYIAEPPQFHIKMPQEGNSEEFGLKLIRSKSKHWESQREWRLVCELRECTVDSRAERTIFLRQIPDTAIVRVVLGMRFPPEERKRLSAINVKRAHKVTLQQAQGGDGEYQIKYKEVTL